MNAIMDALSAHSTMSKQALDSERVREGLKDILMDRESCMRGYETKVPDQQQRLVAEC